MPAKFAGALWSMSTNKPGAATAPSAQPASLRGIVSGERFLGHDALSRNAAKAASALHDVGVWQGDTVALLLRNDFAFFEASLAASQLGALTVPLNWHMTADEIAYVLDDCEAKVIIAHSDCLTEAVLAVCEGREVIAVATPPEIQAAYKLTKEKVRINGPIPEWYNWIAQFPEWQEQSRVVPSPMFYTSGTTGMPKGVKRKTVSPEVAARVAVRTGAAFFGASSDGISSIMTGPLYHSAPNAYGMRVIREGGLLVLQPRFNAAELLTLIDRYQISHLHMVPTMFTRLLNLPEQQRLAFDGSSLLHVAHGAAPCPPDVKAAMINWWGKVIVEYYAMTETGIIATCNSEEWLAHKGTVGRAAQGISISILDQDGQECEPGTSGEICIQSETTAFVSYHRAEAKTEQLRRGNYLATGDIGYLDEDGFLFISDRLSDMVISGGVNIYPAEIEKVLVNHPAVRDCAVFGVEDQEFGERLVAAIDVGLDTVSAPLPDHAEFNEYLRKHLAAYKVPREYVLQRTLPREDSGKIKKRLLRNAYLAGELTCLSASQSSQ